MRTIHTRRTIRKYRSDDISEELLHRLLADASRTQTMGNLQLYSVVVTRDAEMKARLAPAHFNLAGPGLDSVTEHGKTKIFLSSGKYILQSK